MPYRQEETAVLLQSAQEAQKGNARDDDAADQQHVGRVEARHSWSELCHPEVHHHVYTEAQHGHPTHLTGENTRCSQVLPHTKHTHLKHSFSCLLTKQLVCHCLSSVLFCTALHLLKYFCFTTLQRKTVYFFTPLHPFTKFSYLLHYR